MSILITRKQYDNAVLMGRLAAYATRDALAAIKSSWSLAGKRYYPTNEAQISFIQQAYGLNAN